MPCVSSWIEKEIAVGCYRGALLSNCEIHERGLAAVKSNALLWREGVLEVS